MIKKIIFISMICCFSQLSCLDTLNDAYNTKSDIPRNGLVGEWLFDSNAVTTTYDTSGSGNDGVLNTNAGPLPFPALTTGHDGAAQSAYSFASVNDSIMVHNTSSLNASSFTVSFFINTEVEGKIIMKDEEGGGAGGGAYQVEVGNDHKLYFDCFNGTVTTNPLFSDSIISFNQWHHVACTFDGSMMRIYIDGMLNGEKPFSGTLFSSLKKTYIGRWVNTIGISSNSFQGTIDNVRIYNRALNYAEVAILANE